jgi:prepilin-type N-terminal cleavage/methylation domain-containing protein
VPRHESNRGAQAGFTLIEVIVVLAISTLIAVPVTAWAISTLRQQDLSQALLRNAVNTGTIGSHFSKDVASAAQLIAHPGGGDCDGGGSGSGGDVVLSVVPSASSNRVVYSEAPSGAATGHNTLWRRECGPTGALASATELFERVVPGSVRLTCLRATGDTTGDPCESATNRRVRLQLTPQTPEASRDVDLHATRRVTPGTDIIRGADSPLAQITVSPRVGYLSTDFTFDGSASRGGGGAATYQWEFPDGSTPTGAVVTRRFASAGYHQVRLRIEGPNASNVAVVTVRVINRYPVAVATYNPDTRVFSATGSSHPDGLPLTYHWFFGDGVVATGATVPSPFAVGTQGTRRAVLWATDSLGNSDTDTVVIELAPVPTGPITITPTPVPVAGKLATVGTVGAGIDPLAVTFSSDDMADRTWSLTRRGSGAPVATSSAASFTHTFGPGDAGEYEIVRLGPGGTPSGEPVAFRLNAAPTADFSSTVAAAGSPTSFRGNGPGGSSDPDGDIISWRWEFGWPGWTATGPTPAHVFTHPGSYLVRLVVTDDDGQTAEIVRPVQIPGTPLVPPPPTWAGGTVSWSPVPGAEGYRVEFWCTAGPPDSRDTEPSQQSVAPPDGYCPDGAASATLRVRANAQWSLPSVGVNRP